MIELQVYFFYWLGALLEPIQRINPGEPLGASWQSLGTARLALEGFESESEQAFLAQAFPRTAAIANDLVAAINDVLPPVGQPVPNLALPIQDWQLARIKGFSTGLTAMLRDESQHAYVMKVEDQRCLSSYSLIERIEDCFTKESWTTIGIEAKREFEESGKCLALERYTGAGFHALRGVECVIRQYIVKLSGALPRKRDWGTYIDVLRQNGADPNLIAVLDNIRTLDRNPLMHPEESLDVDDAVGIFNISQTAVVRLVTGIKK